VACIYYGFVAASIAELASAIPSAGGVYHWASITPGAKWGRTVGFFTGWLNFFGWIFDLASIVSIPANICVQFYALWHPEFVPEAWHTYVAFLLITWFGAGTCIFANRLIPVMQQVGLMLIVVGGLVTIIVVAAMPAQHATSDFVWRAWDNQTGWSGGVAFLTGVLNGAFTIGTCDAVSHMAEELPNPRKDLPKAIAAQIILGTISKSTEFGHRRACANSFQLRSSMPSPSCTPSPTSMLFSPGQAHFRSRQYTLKRPETKPAPSVCCSSSSFRS